MNEITYFLGAGASCLSMPLVNNFEKRFQVYIRFLNANSINKEFIEINENFISNVRLHLSFDTFFKKLFHQNYIDQIAIYKKLLLYYFVFEHLCPLRYYKELAWEILQEEKKFNIDPRYDSLIAGLLKPIQGLCEFYTKVNFITWNYDLNILITIRNFMFSFQPIIQLIDRYNIEQNVFSFSNQLTVIYLNGFVYHKSLDDLKQFDTNMMSNLFQKFCEEFYSTTANELDEIKGLRFAWERVTSNTPSYVPNFINAAKNAVKNSDTIIISGYSFPLYNRLFDQSILSNQNIDGKKIIIRDPREEEIKEILHSDFNITKERYKNATLLDAGKNCDVFFVPNQILK